MNFDLNSRFNELAAKASTGLDVVQAQIQSHVPSIEVNFPSFPSWEQFWAWLQKVPLVGHLFNPMTWFVIGNVVLAVAALRLWMWWLRATTPAKWLTPQQIDQALKKTSPDSLAELLEGISLEQLKAINQASQKLLLRYDAMLEQRLPRMTDEAADTTQTQEEPKS